MPVTITRCRRIFSHSVLTTDLVTSPRPFSRVGLHGRGAGVASRIDFEQDTDQLRRRPTIRILTAGAARSAWRDRRLEGGGTFGRLREHERSASVGQRTRAQAAA